MTNPEAKREPVIEAPPVRKPWRTPQIISSSPKTTKSGPNYGSDGNYSIS